MNGKCIKILILLNLCLLLTGCIVVGGGIETLRETHTTDIINDSERYNLDYIRSHSDVKRITDKDEIYISDYGLGWTGVVMYIQALCIPVPIPLIIPTRKNYVEYRLVSGKLQSITKQSTTGSSSSCLMGYGIKSEATMKYEWIFGCESEVVGEVVKKEGSGTGNR